MEESTAVDYTELLEQILAEQQAQTAEIQSVKAETVTCSGYVYALQHYVTALIAFTVLTFCWSCIRQWRRNVLKMGV